MIIKILLCYKFGDKN